MNHILFITPYYPPEKAAPAIRISETALCLVQKGYHVTVLTTFPNYPTGSVPTEYRKCIVREENDQGVRIVRVWSYVTENKGFLLRILAQLSFGCLTPLIGSKFVSHPDIIIAESPPLFDAIAVRLLSHQKRCPFIFTVSDLWPETAVQLGVLRNRVLIRLAEWLEWSTYRRAALVWAVTEGIRARLIQRGLGVERVFVLTNGVDTSKFTPLPQAQGRAELGLDKRFTVLYAGTHGLAQGLTTLLEAAELLRSHPDIHILLVGEGVEKVHLTADAARRGLQNITFHASLPHDKMPLLLASADVCLVPLRKVPLFQGALPSKLYEIMACARPIILGVEGEASKLVVESAGAAMAIEPENAEELARAILYLYEHPEVGTLMGQRGRVYVEAQFDRNQLVAALELHILMVLGQGVPVNLPVEAQ